MRRWWILAVICLAQLMDVLDSTIGLMPAIPESTRSPVILGLLDHAGEKNWPQLGKVQVRYHGAFACIIGVLPSGDSSSSSARFAS